tara:strand:- start:365 stop:478 length:114 start_codon:yes stop_codon:yes gene_type:complete
MRERSTTIAVDRQPDIGAPFSSTNHNFMVVNAVNGIV